MAAIFNDLVISYEGQDYAVKPTFAMINKIEQPVLSGGLGISLAGIVARATRGEVQITEVARILALMLKEHGVDASGEDMYVSIMESDNIMDVVNTVSTAFFPVVRDPDKKHQVSGKKK
ncbi:MAG: gene transfer agent family protein [Chlorobiaceae bacterium]|nr:gene transfer agent family protein [Chlorobiaceae bacterium]